MNPAPPFDQIYAAVQRISPTPDPDWKAFEECVGVRHFKKGALLHRIGSVANEIFFINRGGVRMFEPKAGGEEINYMFSFENTFISSYASFLTRQPSHDGIEALEDTEALYFVYPDVQRLYRHYHSWERFGRLIDEHIFMLITERLHDLLYCTPRERYLKMLDRAPEVAARVPQYHLASYLGIQPPSLSRIRRQLAASKRQHEPRRRNDMP